MPATLCDDGPGAPTSEVQAHFIGGLKIVYDLALYRSFNKNKPPEGHAVG
ncbi:MAG: hypothetical protein IPO29_05085 [Anaerolineae bacterium]|nr:hypothetical protein [Anaerolineae bacterium]HRA55237.1 hypothetical protein [Thermoflexales bacterium]